MEAVPAKNDSARSSQRFSFHSLWCYFHAYWLWAYRISVFDRVHTVRPAGWLRGPFGTCTPVCIGRFVLDRLFRIHPWRVPVYCSFSHNHRWGSDGQRNARSSFAHIPFVLPGLLRSLAKNLLPGASGNASVLSIFFGHRFVYPWHCGGGYMGLVGLE